jgi:hypothetical protein
MRTRTTFGAYRMTYVASLHNCWCVPLDLCLKVTAVHKYSILIGIIRNVRYAPRNRCITHSLCHGLLYYRTRRNTLMLLPYKLMSYHDTTYVVRSRAMSQLMLLDHDRMIYVIRNITYDAIDVHR